MNKEEIINLIKEIKSIKTLEALVSFIKQYSKGFECCTFIGKKETFLESDILDYLKENKMAFRKTIELKKRNYKYVSEVDGVAIHTAAETKISTQKSIYTDFIKFNLVVDAQIEKLDIKEPELWEMDEDNNWNKFIKELSNQVEIEIYDIEIFA